MQRKAMLVLLAALLLLGACGGPVPNKPQLDRDTEALLAHVDWVYDHIKRTRAATDAFADVLEEFDLANELWHIALRLETKNIISLAEEAEGISVPLPEMYDAHQQYLEAMKHLRIAAETTLEAIETIDPEMMSQVDGHVRQYADSVNKSIEMYIELMKERREGN